jgi:hypothetical protein
MSNKDKFKYVLKVLGSCRTLEQVETTKKWYRSISKFISCNELECINHSFTFNHYEFSQYGYIMRLSSIIKKDTDETSVP